MSRPGVRLRPTLVWLHRWTGLTVGLVFAIVSVSGSLLLFQDQFFSWAHGAVIPDDLAQDVRLLDRWVANAKTAAPGLIGPITIWTPHADHNVSDAGMVVFAGQKPGGLGNMGLVGVLVAPSTGDVLGVVDIDRSPAYAPLFLHRDLWAGTVGRAVSGVMAAGTLFLLVAGLYLWWPPRAKAIGRKLSPRPWRGTFTQAARLHDWIGVWTLAVLIVLAFSGLYLAQPSWVEPALHILPGVEEADHDAMANEPCADAPGGAAEGERGGAAPSRVSDAAPAAGATAPGAGGAALGFDAAVAKARTLVPEGRLLRLFPHDRVSRRWEIGFASPDSDAGHRETHVEVDLRCGTAAIESSPAQRTPREATEMWLVGLHDGSALGTGGKIAVAIAGLAPVALAWSGILMWLRRRRVLAAKRQALATAVPESRQDVAASF